MSKYLSFMYKSYKKHSKWCYNTNDYIKKINEIYIWYIRTLRTRHHPWCSTLSCIPNHHKIDYHISAKDQCWSIIQFEVWLTNNTNHHIKKTEALQKFEDLEKIADLTKFFLFFFQLLNETGDLNCQIAKCLEFVE